MVIALEKLPPVGVVARATMGSVLILAHVSVAVHSHLQLVKTIFSCDFLGSFIYIEIFVFLSKEGKLLISVLLKEKSLYSYWNSFDHFMLSGM